MTDVNYFWYEESSLPPGVGFELFGKAHTAVIVLIIVTLTAAALYYYRARSGTRKLFLYAIAVFLPVLELLKIFFLIRKGSFGIGYLPLHLCSLSIYLYPLYVFLKQGRVKLFLGDLCCLILLPAGVGTVLFPDWTMYPLISFMSLSSFVWHTLQIMLPVCILAAGEAKPDFKSALKSILFLAVLAVPVYLFDRYFSCNYWFLLYPVPGPFGLIYTVFGYSLYLPALIITAACIILITQTILYFLLSFRSER